MVSALPESLEGILLGACFEVAEPIVAPGVSASIYGPPTMSNRRSGADRGGGLRFSCQIFAQSTQPPFAKTSFHPCNSSIVAVEPPHWVFFFASSKAA